MDMTKEALKLFIQSLPTGCMFEIITFGSTFKVVSEGFGLKGFKNDDKTVKNVKSYIEKMDANMGGTEIY